MDFFEKLRLHLTAIGDRQRCIASIRSQHEQRFLGRHRRNPKRGSPEAGLAMPVEPRGGPLPMEGGAAAPLNFED